MGGWLGELKWRTLFRPSNVSLSHFHKKPSQSLKCFHSNIPGMTREWRNLNWTEAKPRSNRYLIHIEKKKSNQKLLNYSIFWTTENNERPNKKSVFVRIIASHRGATEILNRNQAKQLHSNEKVHTQKRGELISTNSSAITSNNPIAIYSMVHQHLSPPDWADL